MTVLEEQRPELLIQEQKKALALDNVRKKSKEFHTLFTSPVGVKILKYLEDEFDPDILIGPDDSVTNYNIGKRDVVVYIRQMIRVTENAG